MGRCPELLERGKRRFDMRRRLHAEPPSIDLARQRRHAGRAAKIQLGDPRWLERGDLRRLREQAIEGLVRRLDRSAEPFRESRGEHRAAFTVTCCEDGAHRDLETVDRPGGRGPGWSLAWDPTRGDLSGWREVEGLFTRESTGERARRRKTGDDAQGRATWRLRDLDPAATFPERRVRRYRFPSTASTPAIARRRKASIALNRRAGDTRSKARLSGARAVRARRSSPGVMR
jgi:hypothetical protein